MRLFIQIAVSSLAVACAASQSEPAHEGPMPASAGPSEGPVASGPPSPGTSCAKEIAIQCPEGETDGCSMKAPAGDALTLTHVCVPASETAGPPCEQEVAKACAPGSTDACLLEPRPSKMHVCVSTL